MDDTYISQAYGIRIWNL